MMIRTVSIIFLGLIVPLSACHKPPGEDKTKEVLSQSSPSPTSVEAPMSKASDEDQARIKALPSPLDQADYMNGKAQFVKCRSCHTISPEGMNLTGPGLYGIYGRKVAVDKTYNYSDAMKSQTMTWDYANLDTYLTKPNAMVNGTKMAFAGIKKPEDRRDLIAYLALQSDDKKLKD
jgi:cytochrome c